MDKNGVSTCLIDGVIHDLLLKKRDFSGECDIGGRWAWAAGLKYRKITEVN